MAAPAARMGPSSYSASCGRVVLQVSQGVLIGLWFAATCDDPQVLWISQRVPQAVSWYRFEEIAAGGVMHRKSLPVKVGAHPSSRVVPHRRRCSTAPSSAT